MRTGLKIRSTRRRFVGGVAAAGAAPILGRDGLELAAKSRQEATPEAVGEAVMPEWRFVVLAYQDPYSGALLQPQEPEAGKRYVGAEVEIRNDSERPLAINPGQIRLRDAEAVDFSSSGVVGSDPRLYDVNMLPGERVRGWVWFGVPEEITAGELIYIPSAPQLRVAVGAGAEVESEG